jgi:hypothetical protein
LAQAWPDWLQPDDYQLPVAKFVLSMQAMKSVVESALIKLMDFSWIAGSSYTTLLMKKESVC